MPSRPNRWLLGICLALAGLTLRATDLNNNLEQDVGLSSLYRFRGIADAPDDAVIVAIDARSTKLLGLPDSFARWPRAVHACVVDKLNKAGASVIAFDMHFTMMSVPNIQYPSASRLHPEVLYCLVKRHNTSNDQAFAEAIGAAGNVVLVKQVDATRQDRLGFVDGPTVRNAPEGLLLSQFKERALAVSAWSLPVQPQRIERFWLTHPSTGWTLPVMTLFAHRRDALQGLRARENTRSFEDSQFIRRLSHRGLSVNTASAADGISSDADELRRLYRSGGPKRSTFFGGAAQTSGSDAYQSFAKIFSGPDSRLLNYYGPSGTIRTIAYHELLLAEKYGGLDELNLKDKAVFIGYSDRRNPGSKDHYDTVFRKRGEDGMSGVEIAATAFSNLLSDNSISLLKPGFELVLIAAVGLAYGLLIVHLSLMLSVISCALLAGAYFLCAGSVFSSHAIAMPLVVPLGFQLPIAIGCGIIFSYRQARRALGRYVPVSFAHSWLIDSTANTVGKEVYGTCLITDIAGYTAIAEQLSPLKLRDFLNEYLEQLQSPIYRHQGVVLDVVGDGNSAVWSSQTQDARTRNQACCAALEIQDAVGTFNLKLDSPTFSTRIGLHSGKIVIGEIGSANYHSYAMVGDIVNTASRIETLSKQLGTTLLASEQTIVGLDFATRRLGSFQLAGKREVLSIHEVLGHVSNEGFSVQRLRCLFEVVVRLCEAGGWTEAEKKLLELLEEYPDDGPSRFYLERCRSVLRGTDLGDDPSVISMSAK